MIKVRIHKQNIKESIEVVLSQSNFNKIRNIENERILNNEDKISIDIINDKHKFVKSEQEEIFNWLK